MTIMSITKATTFARRGNHTMAAVEAMPVPAFQTIYNQSTTHRLTRAREEHNGRPLWKLVTEGGEEWMLPRAKDALRITHIGADPRNRVLNKYFADFGPSAGDPDEYEFVVDVGAFIGELSRRLAERGVQVLAIEADGRNAACLEHNVPDNVTTVHTAAWHSDEFISFRQAEHSSESSALTLDAGATERSRTQIKAKRVSKICEEHDFEPDLVKIEAEGAEPEVLAGAVDLDCKMVIEVSEERAGSSPRTVCAGILSSHGYKPKSSKKTDVQLGVPLS